MEFHIWNYRVEAELLCCNYYLFTVCCFADFVIFWKLYLLRISLCYVSSSHKLTCSKKWLIYYNDHSFQNEENVLNMTLNDVNGVSLIALHCSHECVTLNTVFQSGWQMCHINIALFIWCICCYTHMQKSVSKMTCLFFGNSESYIHFNKQIEIHTSHFSVVAH